MSRPMAVRRGMLLGSSQPTVRWVTFRSIWLIGPPPRRLEDCRAGRARLSPVRVSLDVTPLASAHDAPQIAAHQGLPPEEADPRAYQHVGAVRDLGLEAAAAGDQDGDPPDAADEDAGE